jgi:tetratricopeptide (TPR) repeat protein
MIDKPLSLDELDTACQARWREGDIETCRGLAQRLLDRAREVDDTLMQAQGLLHLSRCALRSSHYLLTVELSEQARQLLRLEEQVDAEVEALALACNALTALRRFDEAIAAGQQALLLSDEADHPLSAVVAADPLGLALAWSGQLEASLDCFEQGLNCARELGRADWVAHLAIHRACAAALAIALTREESEPAIDAASLAHLDRVVEEALASCERSPGVLNAVTQRPGRFLLGWVQVLQACWGGRPAVAQALLAQIRPLVNRERGWLDLLVQCAAAEVARVQGRLDQAVDSAAEVVAAGVEVSHLALADLASGLLSRVLADQGRADQALQVERERARRLRQARAMALQAQERCARADLAVRARRQALAEALKRPSEDSLTGLADRTQFVDRKSTRLNSSHNPASRMPSSA